MTDPESYWTMRGANLIGQEILEEGESARQAPTYVAIATEILSRKFAMVVDVGCNVAALNEFLARRSYRGGYAGIDFNPHAVESVGRRGIAISEGSLRHLAIADAAMECVVVKDVLEHLESLEPLREALRVAAKAAIVSFFIPPTGEPADIQKTELGYYHNRYNEDDLLLLAASCGFRLEKRIDTWETTGTHNRTYVFLRK